MVQKFRREFVDNVGRLHQETITGSRQQPSFPLFVNEVADLVGLGPSTVRRLTGDAPRGSGPVGRRDNRHISDKKILKLAGRSYDPTLRLTTTEEEGVVLTRQDPVTGFNFSAVLGIKPSEVREILTEGQREKLTGG